MASLGIGVAFLLQAATEYKVIARYPVSGDGGFDYVTLDPAAEYEIAPASEPGKQPPRTVKPGTFTVLVLVLAK